MTPNVLIVDDDPALLRLLEKELEGYTDFFSVITAGDGQGALQTLSDTDISLAICDLRMPGMDGFELIGRIIKHYPDIPVMAMTAHDRPKTREVVLKTGAVDYITKPIDGAGLSGRIIKILKKRSEGGSLRKVSLETYLQLVEMEEQTCTLHITHPSGTKSGVLFFREGRLMEARIGSRRGSDAAYELLSWPGVALSIENACPVTEKHIEGELQAILLDAMRSQDESGHSLAEEETAGGAPAESSAADTYSSAENPAGESAAPKEAPSPAPDESFSPAAFAERKLVRAMGENNGIQDVYSDPIWTGMVYQANNAGQVFELGDLNVIYLSRSTEQVLVVPGEENVVVVLDKQVPRENVISVFV